MKRGTVVTFTSRNPLKRTSQFGVVVQKDDEKPGNVLIMVGAKSIPASLHDEPPGGYNVISRPVKELTPMADSVLKHLK